MKPLLSLVSLAILASAATAESGRFAARYVSKDPAGQPSHVTFQKNGTFRWWHWNTEGNGTYTRKGNDLALVVTSRRWRGKGAEPKGGVKLSLRKGVARLSHRDRILKLLDKGGVPVDTLYREDKRR
jgi:hypothetical protein